MTAAHDVVKRRDTGFDEGVVHILAHISRRRAIERQVTTFGADDEFFTSDTIVCEYLQRPTN